MRIRFLFLLLFGLVLPTGSTAFAQQRTVPELKATDVLRAIEKSKRYLIDTQNSDGSWSDGKQFKTGVTALSLLSLLNAGLETDHPAVEKGLKYLRTTGDPKLTYEISLVLMALAAAKEEAKDFRQMLRLARSLERGQITNKENFGSWSYSVEKGSLLNLGGDRSNCQFALLGLREAAHAGIPVKRKTWEEADKHWRQSQNRDGGWAYSGGAGGGSYGSMTAAGISSLVITEEMLREDDDLDASGQLNCCGPPRESDAIERAIDWLGRSFRRGNNPNKDIWLLYYLYGIERAGRLSGQRFFGEHDWYREIGGYLVRVQNRRIGSFTGVGNWENKPEVGTPLALLFLSKGLSPVLVNKLEYGPVRPDNPLEIGDPNWNRQVDDVRHLTQHISGLEGWPKLLTWQTVNVKKAIRFGGVEDLLQSPILYLSGQAAPELTDDEVGLLKEYINQGGFILASGTCSDAFDRGFRDVVDRMYRDEGLSLTPLEPTHEIYRSEYLLDSASVPLEGVDFGCRTAIVLAPGSMNLACLWDKWAVQPPPKRTAEVKMMVQRGMRIGVNIVSYATGREPPKKLDPETKLAGNSEEDPIERGLLQVAKLRHGGGWNTADRALTNLLSELNRSAGTIASPKHRNITATNPNLFKYPIVYMHGREGFSLGEAERNKLRTYLENGGVLFADACCGSPKFDSAFRGLVADLFPERKLQQIPVSQDPALCHELFTSEVGYDLRTVKRKTPETANPDAPINAQVKSVPPVLEGVEIDGRYAVIYSRYDISCALQRQGSSGCAGYIPEDAAKIAINIILYAMLQDVTEKPAAEPEASPLP